MFRAKFLHRIISWNVNKFLVRKKLKPQKSQNCDLQSEHILDLKDTFSKLPCVDKNAFLQGAKLGELEQIFYGFSNFRATKSTDFLRGYTLWGMALKTRTVWSSG